MGKKTLTGYKCTFLVTPKDTYIFNKTDAVKDLQNKKGIGGVRFEVHRINDDEFKVTSRLQTKIKYALMDYYYLLNGLKRNYGSVSNPTILGRYSLYRKEHWVEFEAIDKKSIITRHEWERGLYKVV